MSALNREIQDYLQQSSWIRRMFETGAKLKKQHGADQVHDLSLGNPDLPPPASVGQGLTSIAGQAQEPYAFGYMPNAGYEKVREVLAAELQKEQGVEVGAQDLVLTCGAAGALNSLFRAVLEPGEEVLCPAPYFVEYGFYVANHRAGLKPVPCREQDFHLDLEAIEAGINEKTRIVLINSPHNPTGQVYSRQELQELCSILRHKSSKMSRPIFLASDEPYRFLTYDGCEVPSILPMYQHSLVVSSFSKSHSLAGERVGYILPHPGMPEQAELMQGLIFANRVLGFVNAPAIGQQLLPHILGQGVDVGLYQARRDAMQQVLSQAGYSFVLPKGGFYFFPKAPGGDDVQFVSRLQQELVLAVPGSGFGCPGYFRLAFCVPEEVIRGAGPGLEKAARDF
ncbi:MAG: pyridoxal phosphate-dependent aminotransferase [Desulfohalobiaceae bacterium]